MTFRSNTNVQLEQIWVVMALWTQQRRYRKHCDGRLWRKIVLDALAHGIQSLRIACHKNLTSRLRSLTLWQVFKIESSISSVASLALSNCCWKETETKIERELNTLHWFSTNRTCTRHQPCWRACQVSTQVSVWLKQPERRTWQSLSAVFSSEDRQTGGWDCFQMGLRWGVNTNTAHKPCECLKRSHLHALLGDITPGTSVNTHLMFLSLKCWTGKVGNNPNIMM